MCTHSIGAEGPGNHPEGHPVDAGLLAPEGQHLAHGLTGRHAACGGQLLLQRPLLGGAGDHGDGGAAAEHLSLHMVLRAAELQPDGTR